MRKIIGTLGIAALAVAGMAVATVVPTESASADHDDNPYTWDLGMINPYDENDGDWAFSALPHDHGGGWSACEDIAFYDSVHGDTILGDPDDPDYVDVCGDTDMERSPFYATDGEGLTQMADLDVTYNDNTPEVYFHFYGREIPDTFDSDDYTIRGKVQAIKDTSCGSDQHITLDVEVVSVDSGSVTEIGHVTYGHVDNDTANYDEGDYVSNGSHLVDQYSASDCGWNAHTHIQLVGPNGDGWITDHDVTAGYIRR